MPLADVTQIREPQSRHRRLEQLLEHPDLATNEVLQGNAVVQLKDCRTLMAEAGYKDSTVPNGHPHRKRVYFHDAEGNDWEFVQYLSEDPAERNDYALPDLT